MHLFNCRRKPTSSESLLPLFMCQSGNLAFTLGLVMVREGKPVMVEPLLLLLGGTTSPTVFHYCTHYSLLNGPACLSLSWDGKCLHFPFASPFYLSFKHNRVDIGAFLVFLAGLKRIHHLKFVFILCFLCKEGFGNRCENV